MRYFLLPITIVAWYFIAYFTMTLGVIALLWFFSFSLIWFLLGYSILTGLIFTLFSELPGLLGGLITNGLYRSNKVIASLHGIAGLIGVGLFIYNAITSPISVGNSTGEFTPVLTAMWDESWFKTIMVVINFLILCGLQIYSMAIFPFTSAFLED
ncbi:MAG: hypothetical protein RIF46_07780 [Cyclobacteriaceae bacterium]